jgi:hypothetical protein
METCKQIAPRLATPRRWYVRCRECLSISVVTCAHGPTGARCALCDGRIETMGRIEGGHLRTGTRYEPVCDERCTHATGPKCNCVCGARNHGTGREVEFAIVDSIPRIVPRNPDAARAIVAEYRAALAQAMTRIAPAGRAEYEERAAGHWLDGASYGRFMEYSHLVSQIRAAKKLRTPKGRLKALACVGVRS